MSYITGWVKNIIFLILFTTFLIMFLPENKMRKYVRVIMGFFIITVFISPFTSIFNQNFADLAQIIPEKIVNNDLNLIKKRGEELKKSNQNLLDDYYSKKLKGQIKKVVALEFPEWKNEININIDRSYQITGIQIMLWQNTIKEVKIEPVGYGDTSGNEKLEQENIDNGRIQKVVLLKNKISNILQVPLNIINIEFRSDGNGDF